MNSETLVQRLIKRASIRRAIPRSEPDRISDICEEAAARIIELEKQLSAAIDRINTFLETK